MWSICGGTGRDLITRRLAPAGPGCLPATGHRRDSHRAQLPAGTLSTLPGETILKPRTADRCGGCHLVIQLLRRYAGALHTHLLLMG